MIKSYYTLLLFIFTISCNNKIDNPNLNNTEAIEIQDSAMLSREIKENNCAVSKLYGKWASIEDVKSEISIQNDKYIEIYDGIIMDSLQLNFLEDKKEKKCILTTVSLGSNDTIKYEVANVDDLNLTLIYLDRGNQLTFKRK